MRLALAVLLGLGLSAPAAAGPVRVEIQTESELAAPFLVSVTGHYADLHNGHSRHWKDALVPAGRRQFIPLGPVNLLLNMGVSVAVYHPEYVMERARSRKTPLLVRPVGFETFEPRAWREVMASDETRLGDRKDMPASQVVYHAVGHLQMFLLHYLPAVDADPGRASEETLRDYVAFFDELTRHALASPVREAPTLREASTEKQDAYARSVRKHDLEHRAMLEQLLFRSHEWLTVPPPDRRAVRTLMEKMRYPKTLGEELLTESDLDRLGDFLDRYAEDRAARRDPSRNTSWTHPETRVAYRVFVLDPPRRCAYLSITTDLTQVVDADLGDMTRSVKGRFCRRENGEWRYGLP